MMHGTQTLKTRHYAELDRERTLAEFYRLELRACGCPIKATEAMGEYAARYDAAMAAGRAA
jgi:hypothetical protein